MWFSDVVGVLSGRGGCQILLFVFKPAFFEVVGEYLAALRGECAACDGQAVVESAIGTDIVESMYSAHFGIGCAVDEAADAGVDNGAGAHWARFECDYKCAAVESSVAK